ncbi:hypothetical protein TNCV_1017341 [Trichonephila clavipes]|uniref:Uncharacterized protein n=1 Tax=Trichonephila clavipes TaxID=2585209 RepID=A0A8X6VYA5_TRICX|nr:hypothetical protein TNCV_1017341 [Trichonephila clavipes]
MPCCELPTSGKIAKSLWLQTRCWDCFYGVVAQRLEHDVIATSVQEKSNPVNDETDEDEDNNNNNGNSKGSSNVDAFPALETAMEWYELQLDCCPTQLLLL